MRWLAISIAADNYPAVSLFVTLEGIEGCGKTSQAKLLTDHLRDVENRDVVLTREPGGTGLTQEIRRLLADPESKLDRRAELLLFLADRAQHVASVIRPALERGAIVICDRYSDSTMAYQGHGRGHSLDWLREVNEWASSGLEPDLTLWIDCDIEVGVRRAAKRTGGPGDRFESEPLDFHVRVREGFAALCTEQPHRIVRIDGNGAIEEVAERLRAAVLGRLAESRRASGKTGR